MRVEVVDGEWVDIRPNRKDPSRVDIGLGNRLRAQGVTANMDAAKKVAATLNAIAHGYYPDPCKTHGEIDWDTDEGVFFCPTCKVWL